MSLDDRRVLNPIERVSEALFGLIMVLTFTGSLSVTNPERAEVREMLYGAIGCNLAWGIVDAVMYVMTTLLARARSLRVFKCVQSARDPAEARDAIAGSLDPFVAPRLRTVIYDMVREDLVAVRDVPAQATVTRADLAGALEVFLLVFLSTFPVAIPFIVMSDARLALRTSNAIAVAMLFIGGWSLGHYSGMRPWLVGVSMAAIGAALVGITIALGG